MRVHVTTSTMADADVNDCPVAKKVKLIHNLCGDSTLSCLRSTSDSDYNRTFQRNDLSVDVGRHKERPPNTSPDLLACRSNNTSSTAANRLINMNCHRGVTSSNDMGSSDLSGGDSGFTDLTSVRSADFAQPSAADLDEPDSSTTPCMQRTEQNADCGNFDNDSDEIASTISGLSGLSEISGQDWNPVARPLSWVQRQMFAGVDPRVLLQDILPLHAAIPDSLDTMTLWKLIFNMANEPPQRKKLKHVTTMEDVLNLLETCHRVIVLTGAGVSVSCGIPDFRSRDGIYARLAKDFPDLPDPQAMFDIQYFKKDPRPFYKFAKEIYPGQFEPSPCHKFIKFLEDQGKLLRNYTQNIDTLEQIAGIQKVIECHGSFATASCIRCGYQVDSSAIKDDIFNQTIPRCPQCTPGDDKLAIMKPNIVFFGEGLSDKFHRMIAADKDECDLLIIIGSSLKVRPVALIPSSLPPEVPQILINRERLPHCNFDVQFLGNCDIIINELCRRLGEGWNRICYRDAALMEMKELCPTSTSPLQSTENSVPLSADATSEHSNDPCDSTSYPHRSKHNKCDEGGASGTSEDTTLADVSTIKHLGTMANTEDPDSTNTNEQEVPCLEAASRVSISQNSDHQGTPNIPASNPVTTRLSSLLPENSYLCYKPRQYVFTGAEVYAADLESDLETDLDDNLSIELTDNEADDDCTYSTADNECSNDDDFGSENGDRNINEQEKNLSLPVITDNK